MRIKRTLLIGLVFLLSGCGLTNPRALLDGKDITPEQAVLEVRPVDARPVLVENLEVLGTRTIAGGRKIVIYHAHERPSPFTTRTMLGLGIVEPDGVGWKVIKGSGVGEVGVANVITEAQMLDYGTGMVFPPNERTEVFAQGFATVAKVEATLGNGDVLSDEVTNGGFAIISPVAAEVCEVRALDSNGAVLKTINQIDPAVPVDSQTPNPCPR